MEDHFISSRWIVASEYDTQKKKKFESKYASAAGTLIQSFHNHCMQGYSTLEQQRPSTVLPLHLHVQLRMVFLQALQAHLHTVPLPRFSSHPITVPQTTGRETASSAPRKGRVWRGHRDPRSPGRPLSALLWSGMES